MTLAESLLPRLSEWRPAGAGRHSLAAAFPEAGWTVRLATDKADTLSCLAWELTLTRTGDPPAGLTLKAWAEAVAGRARGLSEPLAVHEVDEGRREALLRSATTARKGEWVGYFEIRLTGLTTAVVRRFTASPATPGRTQVAFALTHEGLANLADAIAG